MTTHSDKHFEEFKDHTRLKHFLLEAYLKRWATILMKPVRGRAFPGVWFIDAFAGAGRDLAGQRGSPVIAAEIADEVNGSLHPGGIDNETGMRVLAIEEDPDRYQLLKQHLEVWTSRKPRFVYTREGTLDEERLDKCLIHFDGAPALFFLDPFGVDGLAAELLPKVLSSDHNELLILFNDEGAVRLCGKAEADETRAFDAITEVLCNPSILGPEDDAARLREAEARVKRSLAGHKSRPNAIAILNRAFGGNAWQTEIRRLPVEQWQERLLELYLDVLARAGATHTLPFAIETIEGRHKYWLVHASRNASAFRAMKDAMHRTRTERATQLGARTDADMASLFADTATLDRPTVTARTDLSHVADAVASQFAGKTVRWGEPDGVKEWVLRHTPTWPWECDALKDVLRRRGFDRKIGRAQAYEFPPRASARAS